MPAKQERADHALAGEAAATQSKQQELGKGISGTEESVKKEPVESEAMAGTEQTSEREVREPSTFSRPWRKPSSQGGARGLSYRPSKTTLDDEGLSRAPRLTRARIVILKMAGKWKLVVVPGAGVVFHDHPASATDEFVPTTFQSVVLIEDEFGGQAEWVPLYEDRPMFFRLGANRREKGRKVGGVGFDRGFKAHYFIRGREERLAAKGFIEDGVSL